MKVTLAKTAGFCFGVQRAVEKVYEEISKENKVYTYGPIIHNEEVVKDLESKGVCVVKDAHELKNLDKGTIVIRSHGLGKEVYDEIEQYKEDGNQKFSIVDATCPFVLKIHRIVEEQSKLGRHIIIIGDKEHPEVQGIMGWCHSKPSVIDSVEEVDKMSLSSNEKVCIVAQTTFNYKKFEELVEIIAKKGYDILVLNTICNATEERQTEARELAGNSEAMIVIGGKHSSNTRKLYEISKKECANTYYIQKLIDLDLNQLKSFRSVGITAGASTPNNIIKEVHTRMSEMSFEQLLEESLVTIHNGEVVDGTV
ncbi:MAG: 4-hydroxy-3-methylbut-2-enyl diphosphate reductase, partial [Clostridiales bacterium]|nr:4-hydroxy-3-methylbut-2-enyl diphosphate reductase [Clostridiales bacterium]